MRKCVTSVIVPAAVSRSRAWQRLRPLTRNKPSMAIPDNDSVYVDAKSFQVVPGKGKGDAGAQIRDFGCP